MPDLDSQVDHIEDDVLRLVFLCCHPSLTPESRAALTLRLVGGLTTAEIARGFLTTESTMRQRISRAKKTLTDARARVRAADRRRPGTPAGRRDGGDLPRLQRGVLRDRRRGLDAAGAGQRGHAAGPAARRPGARRARGARPAGAAGDPGVADAGAARRRRGAGAARGAGPVALGPAADQARPGGAAEGRGAGRARSSRSGATSCRPRSPPSTPARRAPRTPTGAGSRSCTTSWPRPRRDRSSRSTVPSRTAGRSTPARDWPSSRRSTPTALGDSPLIPSVHGDLLERAGLHADAATAFTEAASAHPQRRRTGRAAASRRGEPRPGSASSLRPTKPRFAL